MEYTALMFVALLEYHLAQAAIRLHRQMHLHQINHNIPTAPRVAAEL